MTTLTTQRRGRNAHPGESTRTWANDFGIWHARITFLAPGYTKAELADELDRVRRKARNALRAAITQRNTVGPGWQCRIEEVERDESDMGEIRSITFREKPSTD